MFAVPFSVSLALPLTGVVGFYTALVTESGIRDFDFDWVALD